MKSALALLIGLSYACVTAARAQQPPILAFTGETKQGALRAILGIPGASHLSDLLTLSPEVDRIFIAPRHQYALVTAQKNGTLLLLNLQTLVLKDGVVSLVNTRSTVDGAMQRPDIITFSPGGRHAVIYSRRLRRLQIVSGLPVTPQITLDAVVDPLLAEPKIIAISDEGTIAFAGDQDLLIALDLRAGAAALGGFSDISALSYIPGSADAVVCDRGLGRVVRVQTRPILAIIASYDLPRQSHPGNLSALALSDDGLLALVIDRANATLFRISLTTGHTAAVAVPQEAEAIEPVRLRGLFLLSGASRAPLSLYSPSDPGFLGFVPGSASPGAAWQRHRPRQ